MSGIFLIKQSLQQMLGFSSVAQRANCIISVLPCNPHGYWATGLPLFNLNTQKTAGNDNEWRVAA